MQDSDKFGFYQVDNLKFYSKFDAAVVAEKTGKSLHWNFNDKVFGLYNWSIEPKESLSELYRQRAEQLRSQFDYLVLWYSGGSDSQNILDTFSKNHIPLDEVASYVNLEATGEKNNFLNGEIYNVAVPTVAHVRDTYQPWLKHRLIDLSQPMIDFFSNRTNKFDWIYNVNTYMGPNSIARTNIVDYIPDWANLINQGKKIGFIWGLEKPQVLAANGQFSMVFFDAIDSAFLPHHQHNPKPGLFNELFYWSPALPKLIIKQSHTIKNFFKTVKADSPWLSTIADARSSTVVIDKKIKILVQNGASNLLYPAWYPVPYQVKPSSLIYTSRDTWFFNLPDSDIAKQTWRQGVEYRWKCSPDFLKANVYNPAKGYKYLKSRAYDLGP